jgi:hypothetical protein
MVVGAFAVASSTSSKTSCAWLASALSFNDSSAMREYIVPADQFVNFRGQLTPREVLIFYRALGSIEIEPVQQLLAN